MEIKNFSLDNRLFIGLASLVLIGMIGTLAFSAHTNMVLDQKAAEIKEAQRPADISITVIQDSSCQDCYNTKPIIDAISAQNVKITANKSIEVSDPESQQLIVVHNIVKIPSIIVTGEIEKHSGLKELWSKIGEIKDSTFVLRSIGTPYVEVATGKVRGRVKIIMLMDKDCTECYNVTQHLGALVRFGLPVTDQKVLDVILPEGQQLIEDYDIELLPTLVLTGDLEAYPALKQVWSQVGTIEEDGTYIFRQGISQMGIHKNIITDEIIKPVTNQTANQ